MAAAAEPVGGAEGEGIEQRHAAVDDDVDGAAADLEEVADEAGVALVVRAGHDVLEGLLLGEVALVLDLLAGLDMPGAGGVDVVGAEEADRAVDRDDAAAFVGRARSGGGAGDADADHDDVGLLFGSGDGLGVVKRGKFRLFLGGLVGKGEGMQAGHAQRRGGGDGALQEGTAADFFHDLTSPL